MALNNPKWNPKCNSNNKEGRVKTKMVQMRNNKKCKLSRGEEKC
jgi:hypothetical protein